MLHNARPHRLGSKPKQRPGRRVARQEHAVGIDHQHRGAQVRQDLRLEPLQALHVGGRLAQALVAGSQRRHHAFELLRQTAKLIIPRGPQLKRSQIAPRNGLDTLLELGQR